MAVHDGSRCGGIGSCTRCLERIWNGRTPVLTPTADRFFETFAGAVMALAFLYLIGHVVLAVAR